MATKKTTAKAEADEKALYVDEKTLKEMLQKAAAGRDGRLRRIRQPHQVLLLERPLHGP